MIDAAAFFVFLWAAPICGIEHHAVARFKRSDFVRRRGLYDHAHVPHRGNGGNMHTTMSWAAAVHHALMVHAGNEVGSQAARVNLLEFQFLARSKRRCTACPRVIHGSAVSLGGQRNVIGIFIAAFNLHAAHAGCDDLRNVTQSR